MPDDVPSVSAVIAAYNEADNIRGAVESLLEQDYPALEVIVVDDGSGDGTRDVLSTIGDPRLRVLHQDRGGQYAALVHGIRHAQGKYIARLDADDRALPGRISSQVAFLEAHPDYAWLGTAERRIDEQRGERYDRTYPTDDAAIRRMAARCIPYCHSAVMFRRDITEKGLNYGTRSRFMNDFELFIEIAASHRVANLPEAYVQRKATDESFYQSTYSTRRQNMRLIRLNARAIRRLRLGWWNHGFLLARLLYPWIPNRAKSSIRGLLGLKERAAGS